MAPWKRGGSRNRSDIEICADILRVLSVGPTPKTHVMYKANLSFGMLNAYLDLLIGADLIERKEAHPLKKERGHNEFLYSLTSKGITALAQLEPLKDILGLLELKSQEAVAQ